MEHKSLISNVVFDIDSLVEEALLLQQAPSEDTLTEPPHEIGEAAEPWVCASPKSDGESRALRDNPSRRSADLTISPALGDDLCATGGGDSRSFSIPDLAEKRKSAAETPVIPPLIFRASFESCNLRKAIQVQYIVYTVAHHEENLGGYISNANCLSRVHLSDIL